MKITNFEIDFRAVLYEAVTAATTFWKVTPMGYMLDSYVVENTHSTNTAQISIGITNSTGEIITEQEIPAATILGGTASYPISKIADSDLFVNIAGSGDTFNSCSLNITFIFKRFKPSH